MSTINAVVPDVPVL